MNQALQYISWLFGQWINFLFNAATWNDSNVGGVSIGWIMVAGVLMCVIIKTVLFLPKGELGRIETHQHQIEAAERRKQWGHGK